jgi:serine/threonine-protein kinase
MARGADIVGGHYRLVSVLGQGGMGAVYEAVNTFTERRVAVKVLRAQDGAPPSAIARFLREGKLASRIEHRHVVQVLDMGQSDDGELFIVQELLVGVDLRRWLTARKATASEALGALLPIADALSAAHARGLVHRDVKPENIFLATDPATGEVTPKLIDFGIALDATLSGDARLTRSGPTVGTASYMSPEQARGTSDVGPASDQWSLAAVLFEALTGRAPYVGATYNVVVAQLLTEPPPRADAIDASVPEALGDVLAKALEREPSQRFSSMRALADALDAWRSSSGVALAALTLDGREGASDEPARAHSAWDSNDGGALDEPARLTEELAPPSTLPARVSTREVVSATRGRSLWASLAVVCAAAVLAGLVAPRFSRTARRGAASAARAAVPLDATATSRSTAVPSPAVPSPAVASPAVTEVARDASVTIRLENSVASRRASLSTQPARAARAAADPVVVSVPASTGHTFVARAPSGANGAPLLPPE